MSYSFEPIGIIRSCFTEKFGIPRQPGLVPESRATLEILPPFDRPEAFGDLDGISHVWLLFVFHQALGKRWKTKVRPPRLGGNRSLGVFATRSYYRPNPLGLSVVELAGLDLSDGKVHLNLRAHDLLDGTPVLDVKPYLPYVDQVFDARSPHAPVRPYTALNVAFDQEAKAFLDSQNPTAADHYRRLITQMLEYDPRPAYLQNNQDRKCFGMKLYDLNIRWHMDGTTARVVSIERTGASMQ